MLTIGLFVAATGALSWIYLIGSDDLSESITVATARVARHDIRSSVMATGIIKAQTGAEVDVDSRASGVVKRLYVKVGSRIRRGQLLAELDAAELQARCQQATALLSKAQADLDYAELRFGRVRRLGRKEIVARDDVDAAANSYHRAAAELREMEAMLDLATIRLGYAKIRSPIAGIVASVAVQEGETIRADQPAPTFVTIIDPSKLELRAYVDETDIGRIAHGQTVSFRVDTYGATEFKGRVTAIYPKAEIKDNVVNYVVIIKIDRDNLQGIELRPEMTSSVRIHVTNRSNVIAVPNRALRKRQGGTVVFVPTDEGFKMQGVSVGIRNNNLTEITDGLQEIDSIVINPEQLTQLQ